MSAKCRQFCLGTIPAGLIATSIGSLLYLILAEGVGFEPTNPEGLTVFKTAAIVHSATPPSHSSFLP